MVSVRYGMDHGLKQVCITHTASLRLLVLATNRSVFSTRPQNLVRHRLQHCLEPSLRRVLLFEGKTTPQVKCSFCSLAANTHGSRSMLSLCTHNSDVDECSPAGGSIETIGDGLCDAGKLKLITLFTPEKDSPAERQTFNLSSRLFVLA